MQSFFKVAYEDLWEELANLHTYICKKHNIGFDDTKVDEWHFQHPDGIPEEGPDDLLLDMNDIPQESTMSDSQQPETTLGEANSSNDLGGLELNNKKCQCRDSKSRFGDDFLQISCNFFFDFVKFLSFFMIFFPTLRSNDLGGLELNNKKIRSVSV